MGSTGYADTFEDYIGFLGAADAEAHRVLAATGSLFVHVDPREVHYVKVMLDGVFSQDGGAGRECFQNEIIWAYDYGARTKKRWPAKHDNILWYTKDAERYTFNLEECDRIPYMAPGLVGAEKAARGRVDGCVVAYDCVSDWEREDGVCDAEAAGGAGADCAGALESGEMVLDFFAGSGRRARRQRGTGGSLCWWTRARMRWV